MRRGGGFLPVAPVSSVVECIAHAGIARVGGWQSFGNVEQDVADRGRMSRNIANLRGSSRKCFCWGAFELKSEKRGGWERKSRWAHRDRDWAADAPGPGRRASLRLTESLSGLGAGPRPGPGQVAEHAGLARGPQTGASGWAGTGMTRMASGRPWPPASCQWLTWPGPPRL